MKNHALRKFASVATSLRINLRVHVPAFLLFQFLSIFVGVPNSAQGLPNIERGVIQAAQANATDWHTVTFTSAFPASPVVVMGPATYNGSGPLTVLVRNVTAQGFEFLLAEWPYENASHSEEAISYFAIEPGIHDLGGLKCEARVSSLPVTSAPYAIALTSSLFPAAPAVLPQAVFPAGATSVPVTTRVTERTNIDFMVRIRPQQLSGTTAPALDMHWIAVQPGRGHDWENNVDFQAKVTGESYGDAFKDLFFDYRTINVPSAPAGSQFFLAAIQSHNDSQPATLRYRNPTNSKAELKVQEETSQEADVTHAAEAIATFLMWDTPEPKLNLGTVALDVNNGTSRQDWQTELFSQQYENPVVILGPVSNLGTVPVTLRVRNVSPTQFQLTMQEFDYVADPTHGQENVPYLVMEEGIFNIGGQIWQTGSIENVPNQFTRFDRLPDSTFQQTPVVLAQITSNRDSDAACLRVREVDLTGFQLKVTEEESPKTSGHASEQVNFLAVSPGLSSVGSVKDFECVLIPNAVDHAARNLNFSRPFINDDCRVFAATQSYNESDPFVVRRHALTPDQSVTLLLAEEKSLDTETAHSLESAGLLVIGMLQDHDQDGMPNSWEEDNGLNPNLDDSLLDLDLDGMPNLWEYQHGLIAEVDDSQLDLDQDGMPNLWEFLNGLAANINDSAADLDEDGMPNLWEYQNGLAANLDDSALDKDQDGMPNKWEYDHGLNVNMNDSLSDSDLDELTNLQEFGAGTDPHDSDTDDDGLTDKWEVDHAYNPLDGVDGVRDTDADGLPDWMEDSTPRMNSTDGTDALSDADGDQIPNLFERNLGSDPANGQSYPPPTAIVDPIMGEASSTDNIYTTLTQAIDALPSTGWPIIRVKAGTYNEKLTIAKRVAILGEIGTTPPRIAGPGNDHPVYISAGDAVVLSGLLIQTKEDATIRRSGIRTALGSTTQRIHVSNCMVRGNSDTQGGAFYLLRGATVIEHCTITDNSASSSGDAIYNENAFGTVRIRNSVIWDPAGTSGQEVTGVTSTVSATGSFIRNGQFGANPADPGLTVGGFVTLASPVRDFVQSSSPQGLDIHGQPRDATPDAGFDELVMVDSDGDGLIDSEELYVHGTDPNDPDTDNDGLNDGVEVELGTGPLNADTDDDGMPDAWETAQALNPAVKDAVLDPDMDGLTNIQEFQAQTDPHNRDSDGGGVPDGLEVAMGTDPASVDGSEAGSPPGSGPQLTVYTPAP